MWQGVDASDAHKLEPFLVHALIDVTALKSAVAAESELFAVVPDVMRGLLRRMLRFNANSLDAYRERLQKRLIDIKVQQCLGGLQTVSAIPRIYRRTNKSPPKEPSGYVTEVAGVIAGFHGSNIELLEGRITDGLILQLSER